jgi:hypothetical protein
MALQVLAEGDGGGRRTFSHFDDPGKKGLDTFVGALLKGKREISLLRTEGTRGLELDQFLGLIRETKRIETDDSEHGERSGALVEDWLEGLNVSYSDLRAMVRKFVPEKPQGALDKETIEALDMIEKKIDDVVGGIANIKALFFSEAVDAELLIVE